MATITFSTVADARREACQAVGVLLGTAVAVYLMMAVLAAAGFVGTHADIEQLRRDAALVRPDQAEDVAGQVADVNRRIARYRAWNQYWWADLLVPDGWETVAFVPMPSRHETGPR